MSHTPWQALRQRWQQVQRTTAQQACPSPCMSVCVMKDNIDQCWGCLRTLDEIAHWAVLTQQEQRQVWQRVGAEIDQHFQQA